MAGVKSVNNVGGKNQRGDNNENSNHFEQEVKKQHKIVIECENESKLDTALDEIAEKRCEDLFDVKRIMENEGIDVLSEDEDYYYEAEELEYYDSYGVVDEDE